MSQSRLGSAAADGSSHSAPNALPGPQPVPVPASPHRGRGTEAEGEVDDVVDDDVYRVLSRSWTGAGQFLEPELLENAMLRSNPNPRSDEEGVESEGDDEEEEEGDDSTLDGQDTKPTETSPLLRTQRRNSKASLASSSCSAATAHSTPFLNNVSPTRFRFIFSQVLLGYFIACFDGTIMASSHPVITSYFHASNSASWLSTAFLLTSSAFQPLVGRLSDSLGRKPLFVGCLGVFTVATLGCAVARSIEEFIVARAVCGIGAGGVSALGSIIVSDLVPIE